MKLSIFLLAAALFVPNSARPAHSSTRHMKLATPRGNIPMIVNEPSSPGPHPLLIIAPAKRYLMRERLFERLAEAATQNGFLVVRFNWLFSVAQREPSHDFANEVKDLEDVTNHFSRQSSVRADSITLAAKSLGSQIAMRASLEAYQSLLLLTPNCEPSLPFRGVYAPLLGSERPLYIALSNRDPHCAASQLYEAASDLGPQLSLHILGGDHNFTEASSSNPFAHQDAVIGSSLHWLKSQIREQAP